MSARRTGWAHDSRGGGPDGDGDFAGREGPAAVVFVLQAADLAADALLDERGQAAVAGGVALLGAVAESVVEPGAHAGLTTGLIELKLRHECHIKAWKDTGCAFGQD